VCSGSDVAPGNALRSRPAIGRSPCSTVDGEYYVWTTSARTAGSLSEGYIDGDVVGALPQRQFNIKTARSVARLHGWPMKTYKTVVETAASSLRRSNGPFMRNGCRVIRENPGTHLHDEIERALWIPLSRNERKSGP